MKKSVILAVFLLSGLGPVKAQIDNLSNQSAEWIAIGARNASTDAADLVVYNPAGASVLSNGFHISAGNQFLFRKPTHSYDLGLGQSQQTFSQNSADLLLPNLYLAWSHENIAIFSGIGISGGGATADYPNGSINTDLLGLSVLSAMGGAYLSTREGYLKSSSSYLTTHLGMAYSVNKRLSFALSGRMISANNRTEAGMTFSDSPVDLGDQSLKLHTEENANGVGLTLSMRLVSSPRTTISLRYETTTRLEFETKQLQDDFGMTNDGDTRRRDLPSTLALGFAWNIQPEINFYADLNYYHQTGADWGKSGPASAEQNWSEMAGNSYNASIGMSLQATPKVQLSLGGGFTTFDYSDRDGYYTQAGAFEVIPENNINLNTGIRYKASNSISLTAGYMHAFYGDKNVKALQAYPLDVTVTTSNSLNAASLGLQLTL